MITSARIRALNQPQDGTQRPDPYGWITALRAPAIRKLMAEGGPLQLSLSGQQDLAEISSPDYPGERLIACRNPRPGRRPRPHPQRAAGRHREAARSHPRPRPGRPARRRRADRRRGRQGDQQVQDRQALRGHHHRGQPGRRPQAGPDRRRSRPGRVLRAAHPGSRRRARRARRGHRPQEPQIRRAGLPAHQGRRPGPAAGLPPAGRTRPGARADLHARLLPHLAPAPGLGAAPAPRANENLN